MPPRTVLLWQIHAATALIQANTTRLLALNQSLIADGPATLVRDPAVLRATYGGHLINVEPGAVVLLDDAHHRPAHL